MRLSICYNLDTFVKNIKSGYAFNANGYLLLIFKDKIEIVIILPRKKIHFQGIFEIVQNLKSL